MSEAGLDEALRPLYCLRERVPDWAEKVPRPQCVACAGADAEIVDHSSRREVSLKRCKSLLLACTATPARHMRVVLGLDSELDGAAMRAIMGGSGGLHQNA